MNLKDVKKIYDEYVLNTYTKQNLCLVKGEGCKVWDIGGKEYLDFFPGWAVSGIGHCHPFVVKGIQEQAGKILHVSNNFYNEVQGELAKKIIEHSFKGKVFFSNSGAESNEGAIKLARCYGNPGKFEVISMYKSFHGRTLATLSATGQDKVKKGFDPIPEGFKHVPFNDIAALKNAISDKTAAIMLEPIQGEGGINVATVEYMKELRDICTKKDILLILDEVQTGMGRTGEMFAYKHFGIEPDAMTLAKALGGGIPIGALVVSDKFKDVFGPGKHATTFGGSPIVSRAALAVFEAIEQEGLLENTNKMGAYLVEKIEELKKNNDVIGRIKGKGLMLGVEMEMTDASPVVEKCIAKGLLLNCTQNNILRIMPPMTVNKKEIDKAMSILDDVLDEYKKGII
ncbi:MAG: aspartate aminotransferase family protein [Candidatus Omnitrophica bacterium]|nr:aspartate aminotransferase family protein [Candidatus Omnitrophota bacterium]